MGLTLAQTAFLYGREYGHWEAGKIESIELPDTAALAVEVEVDESLRHQLADLRELGGEVVQRIAEDLHRAVGEADAADLLSQWEGFGRFCRTTLGAGPLTFTSAFGLEHNDPTTEVLSAHPDAKLNEDHTAKWAALWAASWRRRFETPT